MQMTLLCSDPIAASQGLDSSHICSSACQRCNHARPPNITATQPAVYDSRLSHYLRVSRVIAANEIAI